MDYVGLAFKLLPLLERLVELNQQRHIDGSPPLTEAEARAELAGSVAALDAKIAAELSKPPQP